MSIRRCIATQISTGNNGTTYYYVVSATNGTDESADSAEASATINVIGTGVTTTTLARHSGTGSSSNYGAVLSFDATVSGSSTPTGMVTLKDGGSSGTILGSASLTNGACMITTSALTTGSHTNIVAVYAGDSNFASSTSSALSPAQSVSKATPVLTWATPAPINAGTALGSTQLNATSGGVSGHFVYTPASGAVLAEGSHTLSVQFTPNDTANYNTPAARTVTIQVKPVASLTITEAQWSGAGNHYVVSTTDMINAGQATLSSIAFSGTANWGSAVGKLNDGSEGGGGTNNGECLAIMPRRRIRYRSTGRST